MKLVNPLGGAARSERAYHAARMRRRKEPPGGQAGLGEGGAMVERCGSCHAPTSTSRLRNRIEGEQPPRQCGKHLRRKAGHDLGEFLLRFAALHAVHHPGEPIAHHLIVRAFAASARMV